MIALGFHFPGGRYHATPWGHQVNEGLVEWPPCPWRLLRAFISCGYTRLGWAEIPVPALRLLEQFASCLPQYSLPNTSLAHSRHYMPLQTINKKTSELDTTLVLDTWLNVDGELQVQWPLDLDSEERAILTEIVSNIGYLGRSESWVEARILEMHEILPVNCRPHDSQEPRDARREDLVTVLAASPAEVYLQWRSGKVPPLESQGKKPTGPQIKAQQKLEAPFPSDLIDALQWDTVQWKKHGWNQPPGSRWVQYRKVRKQAVTQVASSLRTPTEQPDLILLALATSSGNASALPTLARTLPQAEILHKAMVQKGDEGDGVISPVLTGRDDQRKPLEGHGHTHLLSLDLDEDGHLDHVLLWAPMGFDAAAQRAVRRVRRTWMKGGAGELTVAMAGSANLEKIAELPAALLPVVGCGTTWKSLTPFVPPRFLKKSGSNSAEGQIRAELATRGFPEPVAIEVRMVPLPEDLSEVQRAHFRHFIRRRSRGGNLPPQDLGLFVALTFAEPVRGPLCLGYGAHFGLGQFQRIGS